MLVAITYLHPPDVHTSAENPLDDDLQAQEERGINILHRTVASAAIPETSPQPQCHPGTRTQMLQDLREWALDTQPRTRILWLHGTSGTGKSAVMHTLARQLQDVGGLGGCFSFQRGHAARGNAKMLVATIAYQLALSAPWLRTSISQVVENHPLIVSLHIEAQMRMLISEPYDSHGHRDPVTILIDGLDECEGHDIQVEILRTIRTYASRHLRFIVSSRPEAHIREAFDSPSHVGIYRSFNVEQSIEDVRKYFHDEFLRIHRTIANMSTPWPSPDLLEALVQKSSGLFVYASTVIRFLDDNNHRPTERLSMVLGGDAIQSESAFNALDHLYLTILGSTPRQADLIPILCAIATFDLNAGTIDQLFGLADGQTRLLLRDLHSLLNIKSDDQQEIRWHDASFLDFLNHPSRSQNFYIGSLNHQTALATTLLKFCARRYHTGWPGLSGPRSLSRKLIPFITSLPPAADLCFWIGKMNPDYISALESDQGRMVSWLKQIPSASQDLLKVWEDHAHVPSIELHEGGSAHDLPSLSSAATGVVSDRLDSSPHVAQHSTDALADRSSSILGDEFLKSTTGTRNIAQAEPVPGSSEPQISTFVVFMPDSVFHANDPTAVRREDADFLNEFVTDGGTCSSIHRSMEAQNWVEQNYDGTLLKSLRSVGLGGPIATMLSTEIPALAIFGSILDDRVLRLAQTLSHVSKRPVMIRPPSDNPVTMFSQVTGCGAVPRTEPENHCQTESESESEGPSSESEISEPGDPSTKCGVADNNEESSRSTDRISRPRGGASHRDIFALPIDSSDEIVSKGINRPDNGLHRTAINLHLKLDENCIYDVKIASGTMFKFQTDKAETTDPLTGDLTRPQVLSCVDLKVEVQPLEVLVDRSYSNLGFLVHRSKYIADREYLSRGFDQPSAKATTGTQASTQNTGALNIGLANGKPTVIGTASRSHTTAESEQLAYEKPAPPCYVKEQVGKEWDDDDKSYSSYDIAWHPTKDLTGLPRPVNFRFGMGIKFYGKPERYMSELPRMSHILRNQIILWIHDRRLKAKVCGMVVHTTTYISDIKMSEPRTILERQNVALNLPHEPPAADTASQDHHSANSLDIGLIEKPKETVKDRRKLIPKLPIPFRRKPKKPESIDLPLHEYVARGWDHTNKMWRNIGWPKLDTNELCDAPPGLSAVLNPSPKCGTEDDVAAGEGGQPNTHHEAMLLDEHGNPELTRPTYHPVIADSGTETESSGSNFGGVRIALGGAGGSSDSGRDDTQIDKE
ncbi:putative nwd2 protein [Mycena sanguinolenta]|uniref:Putative nwd2 protein n=1 Tax=Mycena sanguinolenta TaxID=230812 RepID=A0A8H6Z8X6_9AGAR|nr:putative nwd2 protein [Mycena sanguinolenta]